MVLDLILTVTTQVQLGELRRLKSRPSYIHALKSISGKIFVVLGVKKVENLV